MQCVVEPGAAANDRDLVTHGRAAKQRRAEEVDGGIQREYLAGPDRRDRADDPFRCQQVDQPDRVPDAEKPPGAAGPVTRGWQLVVRRQLAGLVLVAVTASLRRHREPSPL